MSDQIKNKQYLMKSHLAEYVKSHSEYDAEGRLEYYYTAQSDLEDGGPCVCTRYSYITGTTRVEYLREYEATWQAAWELF